MQIYEITRKPVKEGVLGGIADELTKAGVNYAAAKTGVNLSPYLAKQDSLVTIKDATGKNHTYSKSGSKWVDTATNKEVDPATAVMLDNQAKQQSTQQSTAPASTPAATAPASTPAATAPASTPAAIAPAPTAPVAQSPEEIRKAKQAVAAKAAQDQMAGKPVTSTAPPATTASAPPPVAATPNFNKGISGYGKTTMNAPTGIPKIAKPAIPATTAPIAQTFKPPVKAPAKLPKSPPDMNQYFADKRAQNRAKYGPASDQIKQSKPGAPTSAEYANLEKRLQQQLAAQGAT